MFVVEKIGIRKYKKYTIDFIHSFIESVINNKILGSNESKNIRPAACLNERCVIFKLNVLAQDIKKKLFLPFLVNCISYIILIILKTYFKCYPKEMLKKWNRPFSLILV